MFGRGLVFVDIFIVTIFVFFNKVIMVSTQSTYLYEKVADKRFTNVIATYSNATPIHCGSLCSQYTWCPVYNFHPVDQVCQLCSYEPGNDPLMTDDIGWDIYIYKDDDCLNSPCLNNGSCMDNIGHYECTCVTGWGGQNCERATSCMDGWQRSQDSCYLFVGTNLWKNEAQANCVNLVSIAHLADIQSEVELSFMINMLNGLTIDFIVLLGGSLVGPYPNFEWSDGTPVGLWATNEPDGMGVQGCVCAHRLQGYGLVDIVCDEQQQPSLCEYELDI